MTWKKNTNGAQWSKAHLTVISWLDMKCNLRKSLLRFMLMLALSLENVERAALVQFR